MRGDLATTFSLRANSGHSLGTVSRDFAWKLITLHCDAKGSLQKVEKFLQLFCSAAGSKRSCGWHDNRAPICYISLQRGPWLSSHAKCLAHTLVLFHLLHRIVVEFSGANVGSIPHSDVLPQESLIHLWRNPDIDTYMGNIDIVFVLLFCHRFLHVCILVQQCRAHNNYHHIDFYLCAYSSKAQTPNNPVGLALSDTSQATGDVHGAKSKPRLLHNFRHISGLPVSVCCYDVHC